MKIAILTSDAIRHKFVANQISMNTDSSLVFSECKTGNLQMSSDDKYGSALIKNHFRCRDEAEKRFFPGNDHFNARSILLRYGEINSVHVCSLIKKYKPDAVFIFGASIIKEPLLSLLPKGKTVNLHLGLSPYYRGSGTNFWPFVYQELDYLGATILHLDSGIDTGDIITHVRPKIESGDDVHTIGCKIIKSSASTLVEITDMLKDGIALNRIKQWKIQNKRFCKRKDFNEEALKKYADNINQGLIERYLNGDKNDILLVSLRRGN